MEIWYKDWQNTQHARIFDGRAGFDARNLVRDFQAHNDVRLLSERLDPQREATLLEVGCATGEFYRYLRVAHPRIGYWGVDISEPALARARNKYPEGRFMRVMPGQSLKDVMPASGLPSAPHIIFSKDVIQHQTHPFEFLSDLIQTAAELVVFRGRTRDRGKTELNPDVSCQYHYGGWMPYIILNLDELLEHIRGMVPKSEVVVYRHHMVLGGQHGRYLPKDCYLKETGTAETAVGVILNSDRPGRVAVEDRVDQNPRYTIDYLVRRGLQRAVGRLRR